LCLWNTTYSYGGLQSIMARSTYIYLVRDNRSYSTVIGAFTVKHECQSFLKRYEDISQLWIQRYNDGGTSCPVGIKAEDFLNGSTTQQKEIR
jgi:hypothetical protein